ncbi:HTH-type transcriptional regulator YesS [compost metagenome]
MYTSGKLGNITLPQLPANKSHLLVDDTYYFYQTGAFSGFTYLNIIPGASISEQVSRLQVTLVILLMLTLVVSAIISIWLSIRFNKPVKQIVSSISTTAGKGGLFKSTIKEFELIGQKLDDMKQSNARIELDLIQKNNQLVTYGFLNKLKNIYNGSIAHVDITMMKECRFVVYQLIYKDRFWEEMKGEPGPLTYCIYEYIKNSIRQIFPDALTLQVESRQLLSVINKADNAALQTYIEELQHVLSHDSEYYFLTIAVSPPYEHLTDFTEAYEQTIRLLQERKLNEHTQVVWESTKRQSANLLTPAQEQQFDSNLAAGNAQELLHLLDRHLALMERKHATAQQFHQFVVDIVSKVRKTMNGLQLSDQAVESVVSNLNVTLSFYSMRQFRKFFSQLLVAACEEIQSKQSNGDPIINFVIDYVGKHYAEDITLDIVAEHLHITGGYLSTYFKEKTGEYFVDYINVVRIRFAQRLLLETDLKIQDISFKSGYQNINSFNRMFKKFSGMSPREFRKEKLCGQDSSCQN